MATKPKAILSTHDGRETSPITRASNVLFENGQTAQDILNDRQDAMISPVIENSSSMFKVGQGDNVDYSANVVNGAYESMVLKGKSMVNCIQEPSSKDVVLPYEFTDGQYVTINDTKESGALGVELKGQTLVNTITNVEGQYSWVTVDNVTFTHIKDSAGFSFINYNCSLKPNTKYFIRFEYDYVSNENLRLQFGFRTNLGGWDSYGITSTKGVNKATLTTNGTSNNLSVIIMSGQTLESASFGKLMIIEYQEEMENWDIPYFEGITSCKMPILHTVGSLFDAQKIIPNNAFTYSHSTNIGRFEFTNRGDVVANTSIQLPAGTYDISFLIRGVCDNGRVAITFAKDGEAWHGCSRVEVYYGQFGSTTFKEVKFQRTFDAPVTVTLVGHAWTGSTTGSGWCEFKDIRFTPVGKTSSLSLPEEVVLRSLPNGVCDTFNTRTGVYTQRIGEVVLDGSHSTRTVASAVNSELYQPYIISGLSNVKNIKETAITVNCDKLITRSARTTSYPSFTDNSIAQYVDSSAAFVGVLLKSTLGNLTPQQWFESNPVRVQYELETPVITKINLPSTLKSWNTTTHIYSEIPESTLYPILSHSNPSYPVILKPSTKYSIVANSYSNGHTNSPINFNLGGATASTTVGNRVTTITTPSTLSNELLTMSGRGNKLNHVMVIEGEVVGDEPYFEGICDCKSPILSNIGKNLWNDDLVTVGCLGYHANQCSFVRNSKHSFTVTPNNTDSGQTIMCPVFLKANHTYRITCNITGEDTWLQNLVLGDKDLTRFDTTSDFNGGQNIDRLITPSRDVYYVQLNGRFSQTTKPTTFNNVQIEESSSSTTYEPYKSNILSCNGDKIELTRDMFEQGSFTGVTGSSYESLKEINSNRVRTKKLLKLNKDTSYVAKCNEGYLLEIAFYDEECLYTGTYISWTSSKVFNIDKNCYVAIKFRKSSDSSVTVSDFDKANLQIREVDKTIVLRSLSNGVCDTLNVETGEYVQRIGEVVFDGSETWVNPTYDHSEKYLRFDCADKKAVGIGQKLLISDRLVTYYGSSCEGVVSYIAGHVSLNKVVVVIEKSKLSTQDVTGLKQWLQQNPTTVQYVLETPIVKTVDLSGYPFSYENGHVILSSGSIEQSLTPKVEYSVATNRNGQIRSNQKMVERHQKQLDQLQAIILANLVNSQYNQTLTTLKYELSRV